MSDTSLIDQIAERAERLLMRQDELQRTNAILREQISALTHERDSLKSRLLAARARVDALIDRLPGNQEGHPGGDSAPHSEQEVA
ncbi:MAG: DUF904 domain-containing protein [Burkholderiaceae bacterium]|jgi:uncharacterized protein (TIGR02449 family)|nr:DUF904 domain-containing protein [Burkholderiaceae bacterium]